MTAPQDRKDSAVLNVEELERRDLMDASLKAVLTGGVLRVEGTEANDQIVLRRVGANVQVLGTTITNSKGKAVKPLATAITGITIDALAGNDVIWVGSNVKQKVNAQGGAGIDLFLAGPQTQLATDKESAEKLISTREAALWNQLEKSVPSQGKFTLKSIAIGSFSLTNLTATINSEGLSFVGNASLPVVGKVGLAGSVAADNSTYSLTTISRTVKVGSFSLRDASIKLTEKGLTIGGSTDLPVVGTANFTGNIPAKGPYSLVATLPSREMFGGLVKLGQTKLTLTDKAVSVEAQATVSSIGNATFLGSIAADGSYSLKAKASVTIAGFKVDGADLTLGSKQLDVGFVMPVPSIGNVTFGGSYGPGGVWSVTGTYPVNVTIGPVVLKKVGITVANDHLTVSALANVLGIDGIVDAKASATIYKDGRFDMTVDASAANVGGLRFGQAVVTLSNNNAQREYITNLKAVVSIPNGPNITLDGFITAKGDYSLTGTQTLNVGGLQMSQAKFTLTKGSGLTFSAAFVYLVYQVSITGTVASDGRVQFQGSGGTASLPNGFSLGKVSVKADINPPAKSYKLHIEGEANVLVASTKFSADITGNGTTWSAPILKGSAQVGGALSSLFSGSATFAMQSGQASFEGQLGLKAVPGATALVTGTVTSDGDVKVGYKSNTGKWVSQLLDKAGNLVKEWLYHDAAGLKLRQFRAWANGKLTDLEQYTTTGWKELNQYLSTSGKWVEQQLNSAGDILKEWIYHDETGKKLYQWRAWAGGKLTDFEQFTTTGWKELNQYISTSGKWVEQQLNSAGDVLKEWIYYDAAGEKLYQWRAWAGGELTDFEQFTTNGWKELNQYVSTSGKWVEQQLNSAGDVLKEWIYYDKAGEKLYQWRAWASGELTDFEQFTTSGWKELNQYVNSKGKWVEQQLNSAGDVIKQWLYYDDAGEKLQEFARWSGDALVELDKYTSGGVRTLEAYVSTTGNWVERISRNGVETAVRVWNSAGTYLGDELKNFSDAVSNLDPTTSDWWPF